MVSTSRWAVAAVFGFAAVACTPPPVAVPDASTTEAVDAGLLVDGGLKARFDAGINDAHVNSPHQETLDAWTQGGRLAGGRVVVTKRAPLGGTATELFDANGRVVLQTVQAGDGYWLEGRAFEAVRR